MAYPVYKLIGEKDEYFLAAQYRGSYATYVAVTRLPHLNMHLNESYECTPSGIETDDNELHIYHPIRKFEDE
ncbi:hypothetical protein [Aneurinibacillus tyrosinisolvens]|uniref:hypothetical protein n=1 Tax=Aneurinibacillus tyrosinisolvens TaxID=1443435 RepID=UPI00063FB3B1|nr:hypothetical protein [Aneurinibacillus tyrosinisolvens]